MAENKEEKKGLNTNSNTYTILYATALVILVAVLLAVVSQVLSPRQEANKKLDTQKQILVSLNQDIEANEPAALYEELIVDTLTVGEAPVYVAKVAGETKYVLKLHGAGLWGGIGGYLALNEDKNTIYGVNYSHESETPGLGAEIVTEKFRAKFFGKHIKNEAGEIVSVAVMKEGKLAEGKEQVDAISGATITSDGVSVMLENNLKEYAAFLNETCNNKCDTACQIAEEAVVCDSVIVE